MSTFYKKEKNMQMDMLNENPSWQHTYPQVKAVTRMPYTGECWNFATHCLLPCFGSTWFFLSPEYEEMPKWKNAYVFAQPLELSFSIVYHIPP